MSKIVVDTIESSGTTVTVSDNLDAGTNAVTAGSVTGITAASITSGTLGAGASVTNASLANGHVLQVVSTTKTDTSSFSSTSVNTFVDLADMTVTITPTSATSKILVMFTVNITRTSSATQHVRLMRDTTAICIGDAAGSRLRDTVVTRDSPTGGVPYGLALFAVSNSYLDSPGTTSATVYKLQGTLGSTYSGTFYINQSVDDSDADYGPRTASSITVMEIKA